MILETITTPEDVKKLNIGQLETLSDEIRERIVETVNENGGHLASNLGVAEIIVALYYCFDFPKDKLIFDVGHQCYAHKILSGRNDRFPTIRKEGGLSGFPNRTESDFDAFGAGHAGNSVSASLGYCAARDALKEDYYVIDLVGDASLFNGENLEAITTNEKKPKKFIIILNDNGMSISKNNNGFYKIMSTVTTRKSYGKFMSFFEKTIGKSFIGKGLKRFKRFVKRSINGLSVIDSLGFKYVGIFNGNKIGELTRILENVKNSDRGVILHLKTVKGKGLTDAENNAEVYHGVGKNFAHSECTFSKAVGEIISEKAEKDERITAICAAMKDGTGLTSFAEKFPERFFDVGIAEEHAVSFAAGQAAGGLKPVVCVYSTFLQRAYDQIMQDVCLQNLPVIFMVDRAGAVGSDGATHQGLFDLSYLGMIPNMRVFAVKDITELKDVFSYCLSLSSPCAIRYPNGENPDFVFHTPISESLWEFSDISARENPEKNVLLCVGARALRIAEDAARTTDKKVTVVNCRSVKPLDESFLMSLGGKNVITIEENVVSGGFGSSVSEYFSANKIRADLSIIAFPDKFINHAETASQLREAGLTTENIVSKLI